MKKVSILLFGLALCVGCTKSGNCFVNNEATDNMRSKILAVSYIGVLLDRGNLPGVMKGKHGDLKTIEGNDSVGDDEFPQAIKVVASVGNESVIHYWYYVHKETKNSLWLIKRAWTTNDDCKILIESLTLPSLEEQRVANQVLNESDEVERVLRDLGI